MIQRPKNRFGKTSTSHSFLAEWEIFEWEISGWEISG
jgi:hypothetical protein